MGVGVDIHYVVQDLLLLESVTTLCQQWSTPVSWPYPPSHLFFSYVINWGLPQAAVHHFNLGALPWDGSAPLRSAPLQPGCTLSMSIYSDSDHWVLFWRQALNWHHHHDNGAHLLYTSLVGQVLIQEVVEPEVGHLSQNELKPTSLTLPEGGLTTQLLYSWNWATEQKEK